MRRLLSLLTLALSAVACKAPPEAPAEFEELCSYVYKHAADEEPEALAAGLDNMYEWLFEGTNLATTATGYQITNLDQGAVDALNVPSSRGVNNLVGAAVATTHPWNTKTLAQTTVVDEWGDVVPNNYDYFERNFNKNPTCFPDRDCERLGATSYGESKFAGLINVNIWNRIQFRWVETDNDWVMVQRSWLTREAEVSLESMDIFAQYFLAIVFPTQSGDTIRVQATWIDADYGALPVSEDYAKQLIVTSMQNQGDAIDEYIEEKRGN